jgi:hypothetical protein
MSNAFHVAHGFEPTANGILVASYEGVSLLTPAGVTRIGEGDQSNPTGHRGASEVAEGRLSGGARYVATIEPWHGNKVVAYVNSNNRQILDENLRWGHALRCADLDGDGADELIVGIRDPLPGKAERGVRIYRGNAAGDAWEKAEIDPGGVAVEDLAVADLNGDGKPDIVAVGRQTRNIRIYWNQQE